MIGRLLLANALELVVGLGLAEAIGAPVLTSYLLGLAAVGAVTAHLGLVHVTIGWLGLSLLAAASAAWLGHRRAWRRWRAGSGSPWSWVGLAALAALLVRAAPAFAAKRLDDYDAWAMWGMKAKALQELGWADPTLFASPGAATLHLDYPLLLPSLDAVASRAMGRFPPTTIHLQFLLLAVAGVAALYGLLHDRVPRWLLWPWLVAIAAAPALDAQLLTAYADVPLALFVAAGVVAAARWAQHGAACDLVLAAAFLAAASLTKDEGLLFAGAALVALLLATRRVVPVVLAAIGIELVLAPWQLWLAVHHVHSDTLLSVHSLDVKHPGIAPLAIRALLGELLRWQSWPLLLPLFLLAVVAARGSRAAVFAWAWFLVSVVGLAWIYVVSTQEWSLYFSFSGSRIVDSVAIGAAALAPLLAAEALSRIERP